MSLVSMSEILSPYLSYVAAQVGLCLTWSETPKTCFFRDEADMYVYMYIHAHVQRYRHIHAFL